MFIHDKVKIKNKVLGNSFGIIVPIKDISEGNIKEGDEVNVLINEEKVDLRKLFGAHKFKKPTSQIMKEIDEELYNV